jgi:adenosylhomocysteinase
MKSGEKKIQWVESKMKVLNTLYEELKERKPFRGIKIGMSIHLEAKTAYLAYVLHKLGGEVRITGSNPLTTQDDVAQALQERGVEVFAKYGIDEEAYLNFHHKVLENNPDFIVDDGADLGAISIETNVKSIKGSCEETTTGVLRYKAMEKDSSLPFPVFAVNDAMMKYLFDNRYGTGQSTWDGVIRTTNMSVAGKTVVVSGYGWCGKGVAMRAKGLGANVIITEVDPIKAVEAVMDGFRVMKIEEAAKMGDFFLTLTGDIDVVSGKAIENLKDGAILANAGHFDVEISKKDLDRMSVEKTDIKPNIREYKFKDGRRVYLLADGRLVNLAAADGHAVEIMDLSFSVQLLSLLYHKEHPNMENKVYKVPQEIDYKIAKIWLKTYGYEIDALTEKQRKYIDSWK